MSQQTVIALYTNGMFLSCKINVMERISQDVALSIINTIRVKCINAITDENTLPEQIEAYNERDKLLAYEE
jgi:hypothetical protein